MISYLLNKYGVPKTTAALSVLCIVVSVLISATSWQLAGLPNLRFLLIVAFLCPTFIAPPVIFALCRLTENLQNSQNEVVQVNTALQKSEMEKIKVYKAMIHSTHHILNNFLNQMMIFKLTAEETPGFDYDVLSLYEKIIEDASIQIDALSSITNIDEISIRESVASQPDGQLRTE
ncbi:MAG: hypothetical protein KAS94_03380 [Desulfobulbaceae bacterium]|nr:hypothetical protein [Desulfobulbaceae bacterium]